MGKSAKIIMSEDGDQKLISRRYTFKLMNLSDSQNEELHRQRKMYGELWNALLQQREEAYRRQGKTLSHFDQSKEITILRREMPEWSALSSGCAPRVAQSLDEAFKRFFKGCGYPKYCDPSRHPSIPFRDGAGWKMWSIDGSLRWRVKFHAIPGVIKLGGKFPCTPKEVRTCDVLWRDRAWWLSVVVKIDRNRTCGSNKTEVRLNLIDEFASVKTEAMGQMCGPSNPDLKDQDGKNPIILSSLEESPSGHPQNAEGPHESVRRQRRNGPSWHHKNAEDHLKSERDTRFKRGSRRYREWSKRIANIKAHESRSRREMLHRWSTEIVNQASELILIKPSSIKDETESGRGDRRNWGAAVKTKAKINRHILGQAQYSAIQMLAYKAKESGIQFIEITDKTPDISIGKDISDTAKIVRRAKQSMKGETNVKRNQTSSSKRNSRTDEDCHHPQP